MLLSLLIAAVASPTEAPATAPQAAVRLESPKLTEMRAELLKLESEKHSLTSSIVFLALGEPVLLAGAVALLGGILWKGCQREGLGLCIGGSVLIPVGAFFEVFGFLKFRNGRRNVARKDELRALIADEERRSGRAPVIAE